MENHRASSDLLDDRSRKNPSIILVSVHSDRSEHRGRKSRIHLQYAWTGLDLYVGNGAPYVFLRSDRFSLKTPSHARLTTSVARSRSIPKNIYRVDEFSMVGKRRAVSVTRRYRWTNE